MGQTHPTDERDYIPIADHGLIGNLRTAALVSLDGSIESYCVPHFDSPSVFARILDKDKGGHFSITPLRPFTTKQNYLPSSNVLQTKFMNEKGVVSVTDFLPRPSASSNKPLLQWLIRRVECVRGTLLIQMQCAPAFNYARDAHVTTLIDDDSIPTDLDGQLPLKGNVRKKVYEEVLSEDFGQHTRTRTTNSDSDASETEEGLGIPNVDLGVDVTEEPGEIPHKKALFESPNLNMDLRYVTHTDTFTGHGDDGPPDVELELLDLSRKGHKGLGVQSIFELKEGQGVSFIFRMVPGSPIPTNMSRRKCGAGESEADPTNAALKKQATEEKEEAKKDGDVVSDTVDRLDLSQATVGYVPPHKNNHATSVAVDLNVAVRHVGERGFAEGLEAGKKAAQRSGKTGRRPADDPFLTKDLVISLLQTTNRYWYDWIRKTTYNGSWKESVLRSALALKLLIFEPTGAVVASPTFSLPEYIGGVRNWDYRYSWIRDSSFTLYALIRLGFTEEANAYLGFIFDRIRDKNPDGSIQIMYTIHGEKEMEEIELTHLDGHKGSKPVRIGNGAADHVQLDIYGELMDCIYLGQKFGKPLSYDDWVLVREIVDYVVEHRDDPDLSIWEVRDMKRNFTYSKVMLWVAIDRGLRLADKRSLPCPNRFKWLEARDKLYEDIMHKAWNADDKFFGQSYEEKDVLDAAVLIMPLVFFMQASDPRFVSTLKRIMKTPEKGGLTSNNLVYRYDVRKSGDGVGGEEGTFCLCTLWCVEALTRAGSNDRTLLLKAVSMFEDFLLYLNHVGLCTEEISDAGEALGNAVQGFTHVTLISAAYNLSRTMHSRNEPAA
ncbi:Six-hairpin glycosidase [Coprinellus micaceus]|uniref:Six-hairpin glycosidase n=1 Tax=Coprinellus micaceus TaxID=71717 RepID=A0A4Y7SZQ4_COPMI|nr:Six-hairpin glycosidase [Coprinellus micaceus]